MKYNFNIRSIKNIKKETFLKIFTIVVFITLLYMLLSSDFLYFTVYTIDYLLNRSKYTFKEEGQFSDNKFEDK